MILRRYHQSSRVRSILFRTFSVVSIAFTAAWSVATAQVKSHQKISSTQGNFTGPLDDGERFGSSLANLGDLDGDGVVDIAVGAMFDFDGNQFSGAVWILFMNTDGTVKSHQKISNTEGGFGGTLGGNDWFGCSVANIGDIDGDGVVDIAVGTGLDLRGGFPTTAGAFWIVFLNADGSVKNQQRISDTEGGFTGTIELRDFFGGSVAGLGDLDGDDVPDLATGALGDDDGGANTEKGAVWILFLKSDGTVKSFQKISDTEGGLNGLLGNSNRFGTSVANLGDVDGDGIVDLGVGAYTDGDGGVNRGAAWVLFLNSNGTVKASQKISATAGSFSGVLDDFDLFGSAVAGAGDLDGDSVPDMTVGAISDTDGGEIRGAVWVLFLNQDGTVKSHQKISSTEGGFTGTLSFRNEFGVALAGLGDLDQDGKRDIAVGARDDGDGGPGRGAVWVLFSDFESPPTSVAHADSRIPHDYELEVNYPNPFNPSTTIGFSLPVLEHVTLTIYDITGREVAILVDELLNPGTYHLAWQAGKELASGIYTYRLKTGRITETRRMLLLK